MAAAWLVAVVLDHFLFAGQIPSIGAAYHFSRILTVIVIPAIVIVMPMMATSQIMTDLWTLPIRTKTLINLLMLYGAGGAVLG
ncbi:MAG: hypothetical protein JWQ02_3791, partial [Capsulimonas sp.]|nr:hypothetical protein [Capsulimonas sp.]